MTLNAVPAVALPGALRLSVEAEPGVALAVKPTGLPVRPVALADSVLLLEPAVVPSFHDPTVAIPLLFVDCELPVIEPPPPATA